MLLVMNTISQNMIFLPAAKPAAGLQATFFSSSKVASFLDIVLLKKLFEYPLH